MKPNPKLFIFLGVLVLLTSIGLLSACSLLGGTSSSDLEERVSQLEEDNAANKNALATLQQLLEAQRVRIDALTPGSLTPTPAPPPATTPPASTPTPNPDSPLPSSSVTMDKLTITPTQVNIGAAVSVSIEVKNTSAAAGKYNVILIEKRVPTSSSDILEYSNPVSLAASETKTVTFSLTKDSAGVYQVQIGTLTGQFTVVTP